MPVFFHTEGVKFPFNKRNLYKKWIKSVIDFHHKHAGSINIIFTSNDYLISINRRYLNHNYNTDVITFDYNEGKLISGDIFVSIEQININSNEFKIPFDSELSRVIIHGVLHLLGFNDSSSDEKIEIRRREDEAIGLLNRV